VHDRHFKTLGNITGIEGAAGGLWGRGIAQLVIGNNMQCPAGVIPWQARQIERFDDDPLARKGRIPVDQDPLSDGRAISVPSTDVSPAIYPG